MCADLQHQSAQRIYKIKYVQHYIAVFRLTTAAMAMQQYFPFWLLTIIKY
jgi:hypothetical protein